MPGITPHDLANRFAYHAPTGGKVKKHEGIRTECHELAKKIVAVVPPGREQAQAITKLEEVMVWANAGIARNPEVEEPAQVDTAAAPTT
jgi:hypothetical protein